MARCGCRNSSGGTVDTVVAGAHVDVDATDPAAPIVSADAASLAASAAFTGAFAALTTVPVEDVSGTADTIAAGDLGKILRYTDAALVTVTLPAGLAVGSVVNLLFWGAAGGAVQDDGTSVVQPEGAVDQYGEVSCVVVAANTWSVQGAVA
jgi:hypothetical protein